MALIGAAAPEMWHVVCVHSRGLRCRPVWHAGCELRPSCCKLACEPTARARLVPGEEGAMSDTTERQIKVRQVTHVQASWTE